MTTSVTSPLPNPGASSSDSRSLAGRQPLSALKAELFKALGHPVRVRVLELLAIADTPVADMLTDTGVEPSTLSTHLAVLRRAGVVTGRRDGSSVVYSLTDPAVAGFLAAARTFLLRSLAHGAGLLADLESEGAAEFVAVGVSPLQPS